jgi:hypothetical protein
MFSVGSQARRPQKQQPDRQSIQPSIYSSLTPETDQYLLDAAIDNKVALLLQFRRAKTLYRIGAR